MKLNIIEVVLHIEEGIYKDVNRTDTLFPLCVYFMNVEVSSHKLILHYLSVQCT
jgi:hypothetical protein